MRAQPINAFVAAATLSIAAFALAETDHSAHKHDAATTQPTTKPVNKLCPVSGDPIDAKYTVVHDGKVIGFCCEDCPPEFKKDPAKYMKRLK